MKDRCNLCELFANGIVYDEVRKCRGNNPQPSLGAKVHPDQISDAMDHARRHGVPTEFNGDGCPMFTSARHQAAYLKTVGMHNRDGVMG